MKKRKLYTRICACFMALILCLSLAVPAEAALTKRTGKLKQGKYTYTAYSTYTGAGQTMPSSVMLLTMPAHPSA